MGLTCRVLEKRERPMPPSYSKSDHILEQKPLMVALPLCVDLDGTLIRSDMLYEGFCALATDPRVIPTLLLLFRGRAAFKQAVADRAPWIQNFCHITKPY